MISGLNKNNSSKNNPIIVGLFLILSFWLMGFRPVLAYDEIYTHPYLTKLIISQWEKTTGFVLSSNEQNLIIAGSQAEDNPPSRSLNHFYNPLNSQGLSIDNMLVGYATPNWLMSKTKQEEPLFMGSFIWGEGVEAYKAGSSTTTLSEETRIIEREKALAVLGHSLHLLEDMALPAHTRNDQHADGDGYESWVKEQNIFSGQELALDTRLFHQATCVTAEDCLRAMAKFTNANFFSADTIEDKNFPEPKNSLSIGADGYARAHGRLVAWWDKNNKKLILNSQVYRANWRVLAPELINYGTKMMSLFLTSERKVEESLIKKNKPVPRISAGGVKIKDSGEFFLNKPPVAPGTPIRWWPIIDLSQIIPREFLDSAPPIYPTPQVIGIKIIDEPNPEPIINSSSTLNLPPNPPFVLNPIKDPPPKDSLPVPPALIVDTESPQAYFFDLADSYHDTSWTLNWQGIDNISASSSLLFDVDFKLASEWSVFLASTTLSSFVFSAPLTDGAKVDFRVRAIDEAGNIGVWQEATTNYLEPNQHNPLLYEKLEHLYNFSECSGTLARDIIARSDISLKIPWVTGPWNCGVEQDWNQSNYLSAVFTPVASSELTWAFYMKDVSGSGTFSRNRLWLVDATQGYTILQIRPTTQNIRIIVNNTSETTLSSKMPPDHEWHSVFLVVNKNYLSLYVDGVMVEQLLGDFSPSRAVRQMIIVGENAPTQFDEIALWSRSLSSEEIMSYYNIAKPLKPNF